MTTTGCSETVTSFRSERQDLVRADVLDEGFLKILTERPLPLGDLNRSMQHLDSKYREEDVADEAETEDLLQHGAEKLDVGSLAGRRFSA
jgi:hypothetical protein